MGSKATARAAIGLIKIRNHCLFTWHADAGDGDRIVDILPEHCDACIKELCVMMGTSVKLARHDRPHGK